MTIMINDNIKKFRTRKGNTQEELAGYLSITVQAISKWERGESYPDITLLPAIAEFYNVTVDELLGVDAAQKQKRINEIIDQAQRYDDHIEKLDEEGIRARTDAKINRLREAHKEFPNDFRVMRYYMEALLNYAQQNHVELIALGDRILTECTDSELRYEAIFFMCLSCVFVKDNGKAAKYVDMLPPYYYTQERIRSYILTGDALLKHAQIYIVNSIEEVMNTVSWMLRAKEYTPEEKIDVWISVAQLFEVLYNKSDRAYRGGYLLGIYMDITRLYAQMKNIDKTLEYTVFVLEQADSMVSAQDRQLSSPLVNALEYRTAEMGKYDKKWCMAFFDDAVFDFCRDSEAFSLLLRSFSAGNS